MFFLKFDTSYIVRLPDNTPFSLADVSPKDLSWTFCCAKLALSGRWPMNYCRPKKRVRVMYRARKSSKVGSATPQSFEGEQ